MKTDSGFYRVILLFLVLVPFGCSSDMDLSTAFSTLHVRYG